MLYELLSLVTFSFDYPLLVSEFISAKKYVPRGILCVDSLEAFRAFDGLEPDPRKRKLPASSTHQAGQDDQGLKNSCITASPNKQTKFETGCWNVQEHTPPSSKNCVAPPSPKFSEPPNQKSTSLTVRRKLKLVDDSPTSSLNLVDQTDEATCDKSNGSKSSNNAESFSASYDDHSLLEAVEKAEQEYFSPEKTDNQTKIFADQTEIRADLPAYTSCVQSNGETSDTTAGQEKLTQAENLLENDPKTHCENSEARVAERKKSKNKPDPKHDQSNGKKSYRLSEIYHRLFGQPPSVCHTAEDDCLTLLKIIKQKAQVFCNWCDKKAVPLAEVDPMY